MKRHSSFPIVARFFVLLMLTLFSGSLRAEDTVFAKNGEIRGSRPRVPYEGLQPDLVEGATARPATGKPLVRHVYLVKPDIVALTVDSGAVILSTIRKYEPQPGDKVILEGYKIPLSLAEASGVARWVTEEHKKYGYTHLDRIVSRDGKELGVLAGPNAEYLYPVEGFVGEPLDNQATKQKNYAITKADGGTIAPTAVHIKTKAHDQAKANRKFGTRSDIFLVLPEPLVPGKRYTIRRSRYKNYLPHLIATLVLVVCVEPAGAAYSLDKVESTIVIEPDFSHHPCVVVAPNGDLLVFYKLGSERSPSPLCMRRSRDKGTSWGARKNIVPQPGNDAYVTPFAGTSDGTIYLTAKIWTSGSENYLYAHIYESSDNGATWYMNRMPVDGDAGGAFGTKRSTDNGVTFDARPRIWETWQGRHGDCNHFHGVFPDNTRFVAVYYHSKDGEDQVIKSKVIRVKGTGGSGQEAICGRLRACPLRGSVSLPIHAGATARSSSHKGRENDTDATLKGTEATTDEPRISVVDLTRQGRNS